MKRTKFWWLVVIGVSLLASGCDGEGMTIEVKIQEGTVTPQTTAELITVKAVIKKAGEAVVEMGELAVEGFELTVEQVQDSFYVEGWVPQPGDALGLGHALEQVTNK